jgi:hypothetical protein
VLGLLTDAFIYAKILGSLFFTGEPFYMNDLPYSAASNLLAKLGGSIAAVLFL